MSMKNWFRPWVLVTVGIVFNIVSALITNQLISLNNQQLHGLETQTAAIDLRIQSHWQNRLDIERKQEFFMVLLQLQQIRSAGDAGEEREFVTTRIQDFLRQLIADYDLEQEPLASSAPLTMRRVAAVTEQAEQQIISKIDDIYLEKLLLEKQKRPIADANTHWMGLALFLQMLGLILVLARDLQRSPMKLKT